MLELLNQLDGFDSKGDVKVHIVVVCYIHKIVSNIYTRSVEEFGCGKKKDSESCRSATDSLGARITHFTQSHTCLHSFFAVVLSALYPPGYGFGS